MGDFMAVNRARLFRKLKFAREKLRTAATSLHDAELALWSASNTTGIGEQEAALLPHLVRFQQQAEATAKTVWSLMDQIPEPDEEIEVSGHLTMSEILANASGKYCYECEKRYAPKKNNGLCNECMSKEHLARPQSDHPIWCTCEQCREIGLTDARVDGYLSEG
jgi:hypothetical protein